MVTLQGHWLNGSIVDFELNKPNYKFRDKRDEFGLFNQFEILKNSKILEKYT